MINQPEINGSIPEKEQLAINNIRQEILIGEQKVRQLQGAQRQVNSEIQTALEAKAQVIATTEKLTFTKDELVGEINSLTGKVDSLKEKQTILAEEIHSSENGAREINNYCQSEQAKLATARQKLEADQKDYAQDLKELGKNQALYEAKVARLLEALQ